MLFKLLEELLLEFIIRKLAKICGKVFFDWNCQHKEVISLWFRRKPIPFVDAYGKRYLYFCKEKKFSLDDRLSQEESNWIKTELIKIQDAAVDAAANDESYICIDQDGHIEGTEITVILISNFVDILKSDCGEDCEIINENNKLVLKWDD